MHPEIRNARHITLRLGICIQTAKEICYGCAGDLTWRYALNAGATSFSICLATLCFLHVRNSNWLKGTENVHDVIEIVRATQSAEGTMEAITDVHQEEAAGADRKLQKAEQALPNCSEYMVPTWLAVALFFIPSHQRIGGLFFALHNCCPLLKQGLCNICRDTWVRQMCVRHGTLSTVQTCIS